MNYTETATVVSNAIAKFTVRMGCPETTKKGKQCKRMVDAGQDVFGVYPRKCWQHDVPATDREN